MRAGSILALTLAIAYLAAGRGLIGETIADRAYRPNSAGGVADGTQLKRVTVLYTGFGRGSVDPITYCT